MKNDPLNPDYVYQRPTGIYDYVRPGPGPTDFAELPFEPKSKILEGATTLVRKDIRHAIEFAFRRLGSPRAWQLGGEELLRELDSASLQLFTEGARKLLAEMEPGHRYMMCHLGLHTFEGGPWPERDLSNPEIIERFYFGDTMPIEFVEHIAALLPSPEQK